MKETLISVSDKAGGAPESPHLLPVSYTVMNYGASTHWVVKTTSYAASSTVDLPTLNGLAN